jgi:hypothetical protein
MSKNIKKQKIVSGSIAVVSLEDGYHSYCRILEDNSSYCFYNIRTDKELPPDKIIQLPILFIISVYDYAIRKSVWKIIGKLPIEETLKEIPPKFIQDPIQKNQFSLLYSDGTIKPAKKEECIGLERAIVWTPEAVVERLNDHFHNRANPTVESMKNPDLYLIHSKQTPERLEKLLSEINQSDSKVLKASSPDNG